MLCKVVSEELFLEKYNVLKSESMQNNSGSFILLNLIYNLLKIYFQHKNNLKILEEKKR